MQTVKETPHTEKLKIVEKGKALDTFQIELLAMKKFGRKFRREIAKVFEISEVQISNAFNGKAPFVLFKINEFLNSNIEAVDKGISENE